LLVQLIATGLVQNTMAVTVELTETTLATVILVQVAADDMGRVVGKQGRTARSIRNLPNAIGLNTGQRIQLNIEPSTLSS
jgi:predicted RNA-binding protein YlqC (UPF0109 family)